MPVDGLNEKGISQDVVLMLTSSVHRSFWLVNYTAEILQVQVD
jgi:hypothetical protein